jgi:hypothetical protein
MVEDFSRNQATGNKSNEKNCRYLVDAPLPRRCTWRWGPRLATRTARGFGRPSRRALLSPMYLWMRTATLLDPLGTATMSTKKRTRRVLSSPLRARVATHAYDAPLLVFIEWEGTAKLRFSFKHSGSFSFPLGCRYFFVGAFSVLRRKEEIWRWMTEMEECADCWHGWSNKITT